MTQNTIYRFSFPTDIYFGAGSRRLVSEHLKNNSLNRPLIVTDRGVASLSFLKDIRDELLSKDVTTEVFCDINGNPTLSIVEKGKKAFLDHNADCIVGIGGGAALDVAKAVALMIHHPGHLFDYDDALRSPRPVDQSIPYFIALPTTSGTGSEVGRSAVISDDKTHAKKIIFSPRLLAKAVFADPELTLQLPPTITAATGMDALTHCIEAYLAKGFHPICDAIALEGLKIGAKNLLSCVKEPENLESRSMMMMSSMMGAIAFQKGLGVTHSCAHALSTVADLHHGLANGIMATYALTHNLGVAHDRFSTMANAVGLKCADSGLEFLEWLDLLKSDIGIPHKLRDVGIREEQLDDLASNAFLDACHQNNPRPCAKEDFETIFRKAL